MLTFSAQGGELPAATSREIQHLFDYLDHSGGAFNCNGSWYSASEARAHLQKKFEYLSNKDQIHRSEDFIAKAASSSSMSGKVYQVRCGTTAVMDSATWFSNELQNYRKAASSASR